MALLLACQNSGKPPVQQTTTKDPLYLQMANSVLIRNPDPRYLDFRTIPKWEYTNGLVCQAIFEVWERTHDDRFLSYVKLYADSMINEDGSIQTYDLRDFNIDRVNSGKVLFDLERVAPQSKYLKAIDTLRNQMRLQPRNSEGGFWHKNIYPHQMWLDGLYMGTPFLAEYANTFHEDSLYNDVINQFMVIDLHAWNPEKELYYHGWDESRKQQWADPETGLSPHFWGRAMGWLAMALVDVLDYLPENHPRRPQLLEMVNKVATGIARYQDEDSGVWWQVLDQGNREGNYLEASCSSMFVYFLAKSLQKGYIHNRYQKVCDSGYKGLVETFITHDDDGTISLQEVCAVAGLGGKPYRDASYEYYIGEPRRANDPKGVGPFIMAALLMEDPTQK